MPGAHTILSFNDAILLGFSIWVGWRILKDLANWILAQTRGAPK